VMVVFSYGPNLECEHRPDDYDVRNKLMPPRVLVSLTIK
jgi:hypothetical protein